jgi:hypothetical protein
VDGSHWDVNSIVEIQMQCSAFLVESLRDHLQELCFKYPLGPYSDHGDEERAVAEEETDFRNSMVVRSLPGSLTYLSLSNVHIVCVDNLTNLRVLELSYGDLPRFPLGNVLPSLQRFVLLGNPCYRNSGVIPLSQLTNRLCVQAWWAQLTSLELNDQGSPLEFEVHIQGLLKSTRKLKSLTLAVQKKTNGLLLILSNSCPSSLRHLTLRHHKRMFREITTEQHLSLDPGIVMPLRERAIGLEIDLFL